MLAVRESVVNMLPRDVYGRIALGLLSALFLPLSGCVVWWMLRASLLGPAPAPQTAEEWLFLLFVETFFTALFAVSAGGVLWAIATPNWVERAISSYVLKLVFAVFCFCLVGMVLVFWAFWMGF
ncbi:MAG: hypothetical protein O3C40_13820 [Planctomycetota bacterium]|nr:hypothetical protein [Planctomycetota bacterium]